MELIPAPDNVPRTAIIRTDPVFRKKLEDRIEGNGWQTCTRSDLSRAAGFVARAEADLVIIDIGQGPQRAAARHALDGLKHARCETRDIPVILCSAVPTVLRARARTLRQYGVAVTSKTGPGPCCAGQSQYSSGAGSRSRGSDGSAPTE